MCASVARYEYTRIVLGRTSLLVNCAMRQHNTVEDRFKHRIERVAQKKTVDVFIGAFI